MRMRKVNSAFLVTLSVVGIIALYLIHILLIPFNPFKYKAVKSKDGNLTYNGEKYIYADGFAANDGESDEMLSWEKTLILYNKIYYGETASRPNFMYSNWQKDGSVYIRSGYDYTADEYFIEQTNEIVRFSDAFKLSDRSADDLKADLDKYTHCSVSGASKAVPRLRFALTVVELDDGWYAVTRSGDIVYSVSNEFVEALRQNGAI